MSCRPCSLPWIVLASCLLAACSRDAAPPASGASRTIELSVEGMTCTGCEGSVERLLEQQPGVIEVDADFEAGTALVQATDAADPAALVAAVASLDGFHAVVKPTAPRQP